MFHLKVENEKAVEDTAQPAEGEKAEEKETDHDNSNIPFTCGNPRTTIVEGNIKLFRIKDVSQGMERSPIVCTLGIPAFMPVSEYIKFGGPVIQRADEIRFLRDPRPGRFMAVVYFTDQGDADAFLKQVNGKTYSSLSSKVCRALFVAEVSFMAPNGDAVSDASLAEGAAAAAAAGEGEGAGAGAGLSESSGGGTVGLRPRLVELPTCPVCLERLDSSATGLLTTVCNHTFHAACLSKWEDDSCPVCRHCHTAEGDETQCEQCQRNTDLWMCLVCGHIGCGRYAAKHAVQHFEASGHAYALDMTTKRVWDYVGDNYVHRLIQSKCGDKIVEVPDPEPDGPGNPEEAAAGGDGKPGLSMSEKMDVICFEYNVMLMSQLDAQREFYERQMGQLRDEKEEALAQVAKANAETAAALKRTEVAEKCMKAAMKKQSTLQQRIAALEEEVGLLMEANKSMDGNQLGWRKEVDRLKAELAKRTMEFEAKKNDLEEQLKDLYVTLETRDRLAAAAGGAHEIQGSSMVLGTSESKGKKTGRRGRKR